MSSRQPISPICFGVHGADLAARYLYLPETSIAEFGAIMLDPFTTLGIPPEAATPETVRNAYHRLSRQAHPDRPGGSAEAMAQINTARRMLADAAAIEHWRLHFEGRRAPARILPGRPIPLPSAADHTALGPVTMGLVQGILEDHARRWRRRAALAWIKRIFSRSACRNRATKDVPGLHLPEAVSFHADGVLIDYRSRSVPGTNLMVVPHLRRNAETGGLYISWPNGRVVERWSEAGGAVSYEATGAETGVENTRVILRLVGDEPHFGQPFPQYRSPKGLRTAA